MKVAGVLVLSKQRPAVRYVAPPRTAHTVGVLPVSVVLTAAEYRAVAGLDVLTLMRVLE